MDWNDFAKRLTLELSRLPVKSFLIVQGPSGLPYVQAMRSEGVLDAESVGSAFLPRPLAPRQERRLSALGWEPPDGEERKNWWDRYTWRDRGGRASAEHLEACALLAGQMVGSFRDVYGIESPLELVYQASKAGPDGGPLALPGLGIPLAVPEDEARRAASASRGARPSGSALEDALTDARERGDQHGYLELLARATLYLPAPGDPGTAEHQFATAQFGDGTFVLAFTSPGAMDRSLQGQAVHHREATLAELARRWPHPEWQLAVNPGLPSASYLDAKALLEPEEPRRPAAPTPPAPTDVHVAGPSRRRSRDAAAPRADTRTGTRPDIRAPRPQAAKPPLRPEPARSGPQAPAAAAAPPEAPTAPPGGAGAPRPPVRTVRPSAPAAPAPAAASAAAPPPPPAPPAPPAPRPPTPVRRPRPEAAPPTARPPAPPKPPVSPARETPSDPHGLPVAPLYGQGERRREAPVTRQEPAPAREPVPQREPVPRRTEPPIAGQGVEDVPGDAPSEVVVMQKVVRPEHVQHYLEGGYDLVAGYVHRLQDVREIRSPAAMIRALGLVYEGSPFTHADEQVFMIRWPAVKPALFRRPLGGIDEWSMGIIPGGWVIERAPFPGSGYAPGEGPAIPEFKIESQRLPHGAGLYRLDARGAETLVARFDADLRRWLVQLPGGRG
ncbi:SseB protein N-terminal domain-containing protein [Actinomadura meyerae]|uniref:SseB protein N-terminal domain-containing protein n=1 Tax=Actinomadura meyerae TaxID=240840 RepID=A0A239KKW7_9ACTN|nr:SseB family protein [Actinomadura meyerae]SNT17824.1 SseB protein N-terminal domain-containing protein [Actinomadura meyerae]